MADEIDQANHLADQHLKAALANHRKRATMLQWTGRCLNCSEPVADTLFCDVDCAEDYSKRNKQ